MTLIHVPYITDVRYDDCNTIDTLVWYTVIKVMNDVIN